MLAIVLAHPQPNSRKNPAHHESRMMHLCRCATNPLSCSASRLVLFLPTQLGRGPQESALLFLLAQRRLRLVAYLGARIMRARARPVDASWNSRWRERL
jgi:hypothetical protein